MKSNNLFHSLLALAGSSLLVISSAHAQLYWDGNDGAAGFGTATGTWAAPTASTTTSGWSASATGVTAIDGNSVTTLTTDLTNFGNGITGLGAGTITVDGTVASGNMTFASGSGAIELSGGTINLAATTTITVNNATNTIASNVTGASNTSTSAAAGLVKAGTGTLVLTGSHTRSGSTAITGGKLVVRSGTLGTGNIYWPTNNTSLQFQSDSDLSVGNTWSTSARNANRTLVVDRLTPGDATGLIYTFSSQFLIDTNCNLTFSAGSNITSGTPTVNFTANAGFRSSDSNTTPGITLTPNGVNLRANGFSNTRGRTLTLAGNSAGNEMYGPMSNGNAPMNVTKSGTSTWKLSGSQTYSGTTTVSGGILQVDGSLAAGGDLVTVATGGTLNVGASGSIARSVTVSGGTVGLAGTISGAGTKLTLASGTVATAAGTPTVATVDFSAGAGTATASTPLAITSTLNLPGGATATLTGGTSFTAAGTNLADNNVAREISLSGGTLALNRSITIPVALTNPSFETDAGTANNLSYLDITGWDGGTGIEQGTGRTFTPAAPPNQNASTNNKWAFIQNAQTMSQTFTVTEAGTYTVSFAYAGRPGGTPAFGPLYVQAQVDATNVTGVLIPSTSAWTTAVSTPVALTAGSHTLNFAFTNPLGGDKSSVLDAVAVTKLTAFSINLPNTNIAATASSTLDLGTATLNHTLGTLSIANSGTQLTLPLAAGVALAFADSSAIPWAGTLNITGTLGATSLRFGDSADDLTSGQLAKISVNGSGLGTYVLDANGYLVPGGPGPLDHFAISAISSPQTVGTPISAITLTAQDSSNATITSFTGTVDFGGTGGFSGTSANFTAGVLSGFSVTPTNAGSGLTFTVTDLGSGKTGSATITTIQTQYEAWAGGELFGNDANGDGVSNGLAFLLGATGPNVNALGKLPKPTEDNGTLVLTFQMLPASARGTASLALEHGNTLAPGSWITLAIPSSSTTVGDVVFTITGTNPLNVTASIPASKAAAGKLFGRVKGDAL